MSAFADNIVEATAAASTITLPTALFGGLLANSDRLPIYFNWLKYLSVIYYAQCAISQA